MMNAILDAVTTAGTVMGIIAFLCFVLLLCGVLVKVTFDTLSWLFN